ncbi:MAG: GDSL-type esterase/lipase family protein, partial [SAR202 cluster bacterium]|nr:GDSL-type esterase/lipase family protein [SAR202 cluster bacterium]
MEDIRICFIGDSLTNGAADPTYLGWPGRVCADAASKGHLVTYYNLGVRRDSSADILERWESEIQSRVSKEYDNRLVFAFGANDTTIVDGRPRASPEDSEANARRILEKAASTYPTL